MATAAEYVRASTADPAWSHSRRRRWPATAAVAVSLIVVVSVGLPVGLASLTGSLAIPHNDAWSHAAIAQTFARTGEIELRGWNRTGLLGQIVVLGPLGASIVAQHLFVAALACVALVATYLFVAPRAGVTGAVLATAVVGFVPEYGLLATSYMSDMPAFAAVMVCLVLTDRAMRRGSITYLGLAVLVGVWGATVREQTLVAPVVAVISYAIVWRRRHPGLLLLLVAAAGVAFGCFELYRRGLPNGDPPHVDPSLAQGIVTGLHVALTLSLYASPAIALAARPRSWSVATKVTAAATFGGAALFAAVKDGEVFLGNYLDSRGAYSSAASGSRDLIPPAVMYVLALVACLALAALVGLTLSKGLHLDRTSAWFAFLLVLGTVIQAVLGQGVFGRYLLPLLPVVLAAILSVRHPHPRLDGRGRVAWSGSLALSGAILCLSMALTANALSFDAARWAAAEQEVAGGVAASDIDAGLEWVGYHADGPANKAETLAGDLTWYVDMFPESRACVTISASRSGAGEPSATYPYKTFAVLGRSELAIYRQDPCR